jgi:threonine dehydratase
MDQGLDITKERLDKARLTVEKSPLVVKTPLLKNAGELFGLDKKCFTCNVHFKLETLQKTGTEYSILKGDTP